MHSKTSKSSDFAQAAAVPAATSGEYSLHLEQPRENEYANLTSAEHALLPFMAWAWPTIKPHYADVISGLDKLARNHPGCLDASRLIMSVNTAFARPILAWCHRALILELRIARHLQSLQGDTPQARFDAFIELIASDLGRAEIDEKYPHLRSDIFLRASQVANYVLFFLQSVVADYAHLPTVMPSASHPGRLQEFLTQSGDRHAQGTSVVRLQFENGCVFFKPRSMAIDLQFGLLLAMLKRRGVGPDQHTPMVLDCGDYGYAAHVDYREVENEDELRAFYRRFGGLVAISHALGTTDLHYENLIASGAFPVIVDVETLFQPNYGVSGEQKLQRSPYSDTVIYSGLLPFGESDESMQDFSALSGSSESPHAFIPTGCGTDELCLVMQKAEAPVAANLARLHGKMSSPHKYIDEIDAGFEATYCGLMSMKAELIEPQGVLVAFRNLSVRVVVRSTQVYSYLLSALSHPEYLSNDEKRESLLARIRPQKDGWPVHLQCWPSERVALLCGDVPRFTTTVDCRDVRDENGNVFPSVYRNSAWAECRKRVRAMSLRDLKRQRRLLHQAVISTRPPELDHTLSHCHPASPPPTSLCENFRAGDFVAEAVRLGDRIVAAGFRRRDSVILFQLEFRGQDTLRLFPLNKDLYDGVAGLAVFFAELWAQTGMLRFFRAAQAMLASARQEYERPEVSIEWIGGFCGLAGWIYTLAFSSIRLAKPELLDEAFAWLPKLSERIESDKQLDVIGGAAGALLVLTELERIAPGRGALAIARMCAQRLDETAHRDGPGARWIGAAHPKHALTGCSHGAAGIAAALARFAQHSGEQSYATLIHDAHRFERTTRHDGNDGNDAAWQDLRENPTNESASDDNRYAWCNGAPGIGLSRLALPSELRDAAWHEDVESCVALTLQHGFGGSHCLCHGQLGNLELLIAYSEKFPGTIEWRNLAMLILEEGRNGWRCLSLHGPEILGLMTGIAGIGYALLRIANPQKVPSVLLLELP
jgi:type 2 lantibiotic biosynthesis protein LanM